MGKKPTHRGERKSFFIPEKRNNECRTPVERKILKKKKTKNNKKEKENKNKKEKENRRNKSKIIINNLRKNNSKTIEQPKNLEINLLNIGGLTVDKYEELREIFLKKELSILCLTETQKTEDEILLGKDIEYYIHPQKIPTFLLSSYASWSG